MTEPRVTIALQNGIADVRLNRPDKLNALDPTMFAGIEQALAELAAMRGLRCVVLSGEGRGFCAGLDMASMVSGGVGADLHARGEDGANRFQRVAWGWRLLPVPVIAAAHGVALGGGLQILSGADVRIAAPGTRMGVLETRWGIVPDMSGFALWRGTVRADVLRRLVYTAAEFDADQAERFGFVTEIADDPLEAAFALARDIAARSPHAIRAAKRLANLAATGTAAQLLEAESVEQGRLIGSPNQREAVSAAFDRRAAEFSD